MTKIVKASVKGQITLPAAWRKQLNTDLYKIDFYDKKFILEPIERIITNSNKNKSAKLKSKTLSLAEILKKEDESGEWGESIFNADRDNNGRGISTAKLLKMLKEIDG